MLQTFFMLNFHHYQHISHDFDWGYLDNGVKILKKSFIKLAQSESLLKQANDGSTVVEHSTTDPEIYISYPDAPVARRIWKR
jgi:hypothetical protein